MAILFLAALLSTLSYGHHSQYSVNQTFRSSVAKLYPFRDVRAAVISGICYWRYWLLAGVVPCFFHTRKRGTGCRWSVVGSREIDEHKRLLNCKTLAGVHIFAPPEAIQKEYDFVSCRSVK